MRKSLRELENALLKEAGGRLEKYGFSARLREQAYYRTTPHGQSCIHLSLIKHVEDFDVTVDVGIRIDAIEDLISRFSESCRSDLPKQRRPKTFTLGVELGNLECGRPFRLKVALEDDVSRVADEIAMRVESLALPYICKYSNLEVALATLSRDDRDGWLHCPHNVKRAQAACALLAIMGRRSEIPELGAQKLSYLESIKDPQRSQFETFLSELVRTD